MIKRLLGLLIALVIVLSLNVTVFAWPGGSGAWHEPAMIELPPIECLEDCQGEDDDNQN